jgi:signal transduction histidine kinase
MIWTEAAGLLAAAPGAAAYDLILLFAFSLLYAAASLLPETSDWRTASRWRLAAAAGVAVQLMMLALSAALAAGLPFAPEFLASAGYAQLWLLTMALAWPVLAPQGAASFDRSLALLAIGGGAAAWAAPAITTAWDQSLGTSWLAPALALGLDLGLLVLAAWRRPSGWQLLAAGLALTLAGNAAALLAGSSALGLPGLPRLASLAAFPVLMLVGMQALAAPAGARRLPQDSIPGPSGPAPLAPEAVAALIGLLEVTDPARLIQRSVEALGRGLRAAYVLVVNLDSQANWLLFAPGFDLLREQPMRAARQPASLLPEMTQALAERKRLAWEKEDRAEWRVLGRALGIAQAAPGLLLPLSREAKLPASGLLMLTPFGGRHATLKDNQALERAALNLGRRLWQLSTSQSPGGRSEPLPDGALQQAEQQIAQLQAEQAELLQMIAQPPASDLPGGQALAEQVGELQASLQAAQNQIRQLNAEIGRQADRMQDVPRMAGPALDGPEAAARIIQSLRPPMTSVIGYCELLLGKSGEGLDPAQRRYILNIYENVGRISALLGSLLQPGAPPAGPAAGQPPVARADQCLKQAIRRAAPLFKEKHLRLRLNAPPELLPLQAETATVTQILEQLLCQAAEAAPPGSEVVAGIGPAASAQAGFAVLSVAHLGPPGSPDEPAVAVLQGLAESAGGRLWIELQSGQGVRASLLLPLRQTKAPIPPASG